MAVRLVAGLKGLMTVATDYIAWLIRTKTVGETNLFGAFMGMSIVFCVSAWSPDS